MRNAAPRANLLVPEFREVMDIRQASDYLGISPDTLYKYASEGFVPAFKLGNRWRFKRSRLDEWMDRQSDIQNAEPVNPEQKKPVRSGMDKAPARLCIGPVFPGTLERSPPPCLSGWIKCGPVAQLDRASVS